MLFEISSKKFEYIRKLSKKYDSRFSSFDKVSLFLFVSISFSFSSSSTLEKCVLKTDPITVIHCQTYVLHLMVHVVEKKMKTRLRTKFLEISRVSETLISRKVL